MATGPDGERTELLAGLIAPAVADAPRRAAVIDDTTSVNFAELEQYSLALAGAVAARTDPGDRVAVVADNGVPYALLYYAVPRSRRILTLINQRLNPDEQARAIAAAGARVLIGDPRYLNALAASHQMLGQHAQAVHFYGLSQLLDKKDPTPTPTLDPKPVEPKPVGSMGLKNPFETHSTGG